MVRNVPRKPTIYTIRYMFDYGGVFVEQWLSCDFQIRSEFDVCSMCTVRTNLVSLDCVGYNLSNPFGPSLALQNCHVDAITTRNLSSTDSKFGMAEQD
jgi:hypothetical protein